MCKEIRKKKGYRKNVFVTKDEKKKETNDVCVMKERKKKRKG